ncbi:hypothetical protein N0B51_05105 [Tsuneonella sp. YG55]|uniref:Uncharacterized protein n=1 Tax=Tsuneonella litorea TaxID=2976475 RepID=A0A9X2VZY1_9SPHN|nr:hypothetical protein [Tsuneonella litorea]MCT2558353.1 hypothetical protein [Tsuneonella litorea]
MSGGIIGQPGGRRVRYWCAAKGLVGSGGDRRSHRLRFTATPVRAEPV